MIITRTPYRISFFGGGSDYPAWYKHHGGEVLTTTINKYCYVSLREMPPFLGSKYRVQWSHTENTETIDSIEHAGVRGCLQYLKEDKGIEVTHAGDLPSRSGLGSSSAFTVGMLHALHVLNGNSPDKATLAHEAIQVEQDVLKENVGIQDQIECALGGMNHICFDRTGEYTVRSIRLPYKKFIESHMMLFFTDLQRTASDIAKDQINNMDKNESHMKAIVGLVDPAIRALRQGDMREFGTLLDEAWQLKRWLSSKITSPVLNEIYATAIGAGAWGGKLLGAGGGGFFLFVVPPERQEAVAAALKLLWIPVHFEHGGSQVVLK